LTTTTTDKDFSIKLQQNKVVYTSFNSRALDNVAKARELLDRPPVSAPPEQLDYNEYLAITKDYKKKLGLGGFRLPTPCMTDDGAGNFRLFLKT
jgi:hypothetical protein